MDIRFLIQWKEKKNPIYVQVYIYIYTYSSIDGVNIKIKNKNKIKRKKKDKRSLNVRPEMIVPSLSALLPYPPIQHLRNRTPFPHSILLHHLNQKSSCIRMRKHVIKDRTVEQKPR